MTKEAATIRFEADIKQALARGYCDEVNQGKILDSDLINSMTKELLKIVDKLDEQTMQVNNVIFIEMSESERLVTEGYEAAYQMIYESTAINKIYPV